MFEMYRRRLRLALRGCRPKLSLELLSFENEFCLCLFGYLIPLSFLDRWHKEPEECLDSWGVYYDEHHSIVICWGNKRKFIHLPWSWEHCDERHMVQVDGGGWEPCLEEWDKGGPDRRKIWEFPYSYMLRNGEIQEVTAKVYVERREWRRKCFWYIPWFALKRQSICVEFSAEVGERAGSWKGGCIGCGYDMRPGESARDTLLRMERERRFE